MSTVLSVNAMHQGGMRFTAGNGKHTVTMDYPLETEEGTGLRPLEMLLASLAACSGGTLVALLRRMEQPLQGLEVNARGVRRQEHPTVFTEIALEFVVSGAAVDPAAVARALAQAEQRFCPVWAMVKGGAPITVSYRIVAE
jgi:putative redox protein